MIFAKKMIVALFPLMMLGCGNVSNETAQRVLADEGYHDIQMTGYSHFGCGEDDAYKSSFTAKRWVLQGDGSRTERTVEGTLCCGHYKDCTVRH